jgi:hypothetical protein
VVLLPWFEFIGDLPISRAMNESAWLVAVIQAFHLLALVLFTGALLIVDLRLLGRGLTDRPVAEVARSARPWLAGGFAGLVVTGIPQLMSLAVKEYYSQFFWTKMYFLIAALAFMLTVRRAVVRTSEARVPWWLRGAVAIVSLGLWSGVAISARLIGLF